MTLDARAPADAAFTRDKPHRFGNEQGIAQEMIRALFRE